MSKFRWLGVGVCLIVTPFAAGMAALEPWFLWVAWIPIIAGGLLPALGHARAASFSRSARATSVVVILSLLWIGAYCKAKTLKKDITAHHRGHA